MEKFLRERFELLEKYQAELKVKALKQSSSVHPLDVSPYFQSPSSDPHLSRPINGILPTKRLSSQKQRSRRQLDFDTQTFDLSQEKIVADPPLPPPGNVNGQLTSVMRKFVDSGANGRSVSVSRRMVVPNLPAILEHEDATTTSYKSHQSNPSPLVTARESDTTEEAIVTARFEGMEEDDEEVYVEIELPDIHQIAKLRALQQEIIESKEEYTDASSEGEEGEDIDEDSSICLPDLEY